MGRWSLAYTAQPDTANIIPEPNASHGCTLACPEAGVLYGLESLTALNSTEATERGAPLSVFSALSGISGSFIRALRLAFWMERRREV